MKKKLITLLAALLAALSVFGSSLAMPALLLPGLLYDGSGESRNYNLADFAPGDLKSLFIAPMLRSSDAGIKELASGSAESIASAIIADLVPSIMPIDTIDPAEASGTISISPSISPDTFSGKVVISYDDVSAYSYDGTSLSCDGDVEAALYLGGPDGAYITLSVSTSGFILDGEEIDGRLSFSIGLDGNAIGRMLKSSGIDEELYRYLLASAIVSGLAESGDVALMDISTPESLLSFIDMHGMMDIMDFGVLCLAAEDYGITADEVLSAVIFSIDDDGTLFTADIPAVISALSMIGLL